MSRSSVGPNESDSKTPLPDSLMWTEKYRPARLKEVASHPEIIEAIDRLIAAKHLPHLLFYGPPGTGKTSTAGAIVERMYGRHRSVMVLEVNASDDGGIGAIRDKIKPFVAARSLVSDGHKLVILEEADGLTRSAQFALRNIMEKYVANARFCLTVNYVSKIIPALQSRCTRFRFGPIGRAPMREALTTIAKREKIVLKEDGVRALLDHAGGDMRKCLNVLQACHAAPGGVTETTVHEITGQPTISETQSVAHALFNLPLKEAFLEVQRLMAERTLSLSDLVTTLSAFVVATSMNPTTLAFVLDKLADLEYRLATGANETLQLGALVGIFQLAKTGVGTSAATPPASR